MSSRRFGRVVAALALALVVTPAAAASGATTLTQNDLFGVSCAGPHACLAVGAATAKRVSPLVERSTGGAWSIVPATSLSAGTTLTGVACPTATWCAIVGADHAGSLIAQYSGSAVAKVAHPPATPLGSRLTAVTCRSTTWCDAVGQADNQALIVQLRGTKWSVASTPVPGPGVDTLTGVSCPSTAWCVTVGYSAAAVAGVPKAISLWFHGGKWHKVTMAFAGQAPEPRAVSCPTTAWCAAVGGSNGIAGPALSEFVGGKWAKATAPNGLTRSLESVVCVAASSCVTVGNNLAGGRFATLAGTAYTYPTARSVHPPDTFYALSCWARAGCVAAGFASAKTYGSTMALTGQWHGGAWQLALAPDLR